MFVDPKIGGGGGVALRHLDGRICVFRVTSYDPNATYDDELRPSVGVDILVATGDATLLYGDNATTGEPPSKRVAVPCVLTGQMISNVNAVRALAPLVGTQNLMVARVERSQIGKRPWNLERVDANDPGGTLAKRLWTQYASGDFANPEPVDIGAPASAPNAASPWDPTPTPPSESPQQWPQTVPAPAPVSAAYAATPAGQLPMPGPAPAGPQRPPNIPESIWNQMDAATRLAVAPPAAPAAPAAPAVPPGWTPEQWQALSPDQQRQVAGAIAGPM